MTTLSLTISDDMRAFIESEMTQRGHASPSEYVSALIREAQKRLARRELEAKLQAGLDSGPASPMTREEWDSIEREALEIVNAQKIAR